MKYNKTYTPQLSLATTMKALSKYKRLLIDEIKSWHNYFDVEIPMFVKADSNWLLKVDNLTRPITFDFGEKYQVGSMLLTSTNWKRKMIERLNLKVNEGFFSESNHIWRDRITSPSNSIIENELSFQIKVDMNQDLNDYVKRLAQDIYLVFFKLGQKITKSYGLKNIYPKYANYISSQILENEMPEEDFSERERKKLLEDLAIILCAPGTRLFSSKIHRFIPPQLYDLKNYYQILMYDQINSNSISVATISLLANGQILWDQMGKYNCMFLQENHFYRKLINQKYKIIEIKIHFPKLMMALLGKGHIGETQSSNFSSELKQIIDRYHIDII